MNLENTCKLIGSIILTVILGAIPIIFGFSIAFHWNPLIVILLGGATTAELSVLWAYIYFEIKH